MVSAVEERQADVERRVREGREEKAESGVDWGGVGRRGMGVRKDLVLNSAAE